MPRPVVPILPAPAASSRRPSRSRWSGRISGQVSAMQQHSGVTSTPCPASLLDLGLERPRIEHDAVADDATACRARCPSGSSDSL